MMKSLPMIWVITLCCLAFSSSAQALIQVHHGVYKINAVVIRSESGPQALLNAFSRSPCRIQLMGPAAPKIQKELLTARAFKLKIKVQKDLTCGNIQAELLDFQVLGQDKVPVRVNNDFSP
jgi:hypothetical protein